MTANKQFQGSKKKAKRKAFEERRFKREMQPRIDEHREMLLNRAIENGCFEQAIAIMKAGDKP